MNKIELIKTPIRTYFGNSDWNEILLKDETVQLTGAFKIRGVLNKFININKSDYDTIITASTGNHAQAVALCAKYFGKKCIIVVPENTPKCKIDKIKKFSPIIISKNLKNYDMCKEFAKKLAIQKQYLYISSFDDYEIIEGHKSLFHEIDWENIDYCFCPIGGGGIISACLDVLKSRSVEVVGVEIEKNDAMNQSLVAGKKIKIKLDKNSSADGILVSEVGDLNFKIAQENKLKVLTVNEKEIQNAIKNLKYYNNIRAEGAGAASLACALKFQLKNKRCICIISGGNIDDVVYDKIINK